MRVLVSGPATVMKPFGEVSGVAEAAAVCVGGVVDGALERNGVGDGPPIAPPHDDAMSVATSSARFIAAR